MENALLEAPVLLQLTYDQISRYWDDIKQVAIHSCPPNEEFSEESGSVLLTNLLEGSAQAWAMSKDGSLKGLALTSVYREFCLGTKSLIIVGVLAYEGIDEDVWIQGLSTIRGFAKANGCRFVTGFTRIGRVVDIAERLGADVSHTFLKFDLEEA